MTAELFTQKGQLKSAFQKVCLDESLWAEHETFLAYLTAQGETWDAEAYQEWLAGVEKDVLRQLRYYAFLIYRMMWLTQEWGDAGQSQIESSFSRFLLDIKPEDSVSYQNTQQFSDAIDAETEAFGFRDWSTVAIKKAFDELAISLLGRDFDIHEFVPLNSCLRFLGSELFIQGGVYGLAKEFMAGHGFSEVHGDYTCVTLDREVLRSPNTIIAMAAVIGDKDVFIRMESLRTIFFMKWVATVQSWSYGTYYWDDERRLSEGVKRECITRYTEMTPDAVKSVMPVFVEDLRETVMYHELGHGVIQHHLLPMQAATMGETSKVIGENGVTALLEFLADFAPAHAGIKGPLQNMIDVSKTDSERAEKMFWMYVSDTWFFDTDDLYMFLYSDLMAICFVSAVRSDRTVDWELLQSLISPGTEQSMVDFSIRWVESATQEWRELAESATYTLPDHPEVTTFEALMTLIDKELRAEWKGDEPFDETLYAVSAATWARVFESLHQHSDKAEAYHALIEDQDQLLLKSFFAELMTPKDQELYAENLHLYVVDQFRKKGVFWEREEAPTTF